MECEDHGEQLAVGSMSSHLMTRHGKAAGRQRQWTTMTEDRVPQEYQISFPEKGPPRRSPVEGCPGKMVMDGHARALRAPACPRHHGDAVGRKLLPPTVRQV